MKLNIALLQLAPGATLEERLEQGIKACREAKQAGADIALFPEMWSSGYHVAADLEQLRAEAIPADDAFVLAFGRLAEELQMAVAITILEQYEPLPRNTVLLFDRFGRKVLTYAKVHTCDFGDECRLTPGDAFYTADLDTAKGVIKVGAMICYDREFPESARILMLQGAELILVPNACPMEINRLAQLRGRAFENMLAVATCNYPAEKPDCNGHSTVFDGVAYLPGQPEERDFCILETDGAAGVYMAALDLEQLREYRRTEVHGNAYRHPRKYRLLLEETIRAPFIRPDYRP